MQSPKCVCGDPAKTEHYSVNCKIFNVSRQRHIYNLQILIRLSTNVLLFGFDRLTVAQNILIIKAVQNCIKVVFDSHPQSNYSLLPYIFFFISFFDNISFLIHFRFVIEIIDYIFLHICLLFSMYSLLALLFLN